MAKHEYPDKFVSSKNDIPKEPHWVIIEFGSHTVPGWDKNDSDSSAPCLKYEMYLTEQKWKDQIEVRERDPSSYKKSYVALKVIPATIGITVNVDVK